MFTNGVAISLLVVCLTVLTQTDAVPFVACRGSSLGQVVAVDIEGCNGTQRCTIDRNQQRTFSLRFTSSVPLAGSTANVSSLVGGSRVQLPGSGKDVCPNIRPACSDKASACEFTYTRQLTFPSTYAWGIFSARGQLFAASGDVILCAHIEVHLK